MEVSVLLELFISSNEICNTANVCYSFKFQGIKKTKTKKKKQKKKKKKKKKR